MPAASPSAAVAYPLVAALAALPASGGTIEVSSAQTVPANTAVPAGVGLRINPGGLLQGPTSGGPTTLTINGAVDAPAVQIFGANLTVLYGPNVASKPEWLAGAGASNWLYLPAGWDAAWRSAKAASGSTPAWMTGIGDSFTQGLNSSNYLTKSWWALVRAWLLTQYSLYGDFYATTVSQAFASAYVSPPWTFATTPSFGADGFAGVAYWGTNPAQSNLAQFTAPYACTQIDLLYHETWGLNGTFTYALDGEANNTVNVTGNLPYPQRIRRSGLASAIHTLIAGNPSQHNQMNLLGAACYANPGFGIGFANLGYSGTLMQAWTQSAAAPADRMTYLKGVVNGSTPTGFGFPSQPALAIIALGINDCANLNLGPNGFEYGLARMVAALRTGYANCAIIIMANCNPEQMYSDSASNPFTNSNSYPLYVARMEKVARALHCAFVNMHAKWGEYGVTNGLQSGGQAPHPTDAGHADIAATLEMIV